MSTYIQQQGKEFIASTIADKTVGINGLYVECGSRPIEAGPRDSTYFDALRTSNTPFARIAVSGYSVQADGTVTFSGLVYASDLSAPATSSTCVDCITLAHFTDDDPAHDIFVATLDVTGHPVLFGDTAVAVNATLKLG